MSLRRPVQTQGVPCPINGAPYTQAILVDKKFLYISGVLGIDKNTSKPVEGGFEVEMQTLMQHMGAILKVGKSSIDKLIKVTVFLADIKDFTKMNEIYQDFITDHYPARSVMQMSRLPMNAKVEIDAIAISGEVTEDGCTC